MVSPDKNWTTSFADRLALLSNERIDADVILWVGNRQIPTHKFVLDATTDILKADDVHFKADDKQFQVILPLEFGENFDALEDIIRSLYIGCVEVKEDDAKFIYKFAKICNIDWLKKKAFALLESMLTEASFKDVFQFAHSICCDDLKEICFEYLSPDLMDNLSKTGDMLDIDYHCLCSVINGDVVSEMDKFQLVCKWFEYDVPKRICHLEILILTIKFNSIEKADLCNVFEWVVNEENIDAHARVSILKEIKVRANTPTSETVQCSQSKRNGKTLRNQRLTVKKMKDILSGSTTNNEEKKLLFTSYCSIVRNFYHQGDPLTKHIISEFFCKHWTEITTQNDITDLVTLNNYEFHLFSFSMLDGLTEQHFMCFRELVPNINWKALSLDNLKEFVLALQPLEGKYTSENYLMLNVRIVESIVGWFFEHNQQNGEEVLELISSHVCLCYLPEGYVEMVLKPYILLMNSGKRFDYQCYRHETQHFVMETDVPVTIQELQLVKLACWNRELSPKMYTYLMDESFTYQADNRDNSIRYYLKFNPISKQLFQLLRNQYDHYLHCVASSNVNNPKLVLFDKEQCMEKYPVWSKCDLNLDELREMIMKYKKLCIMFFHNSYN